MSERKGPLKVFVVGESSTDPEKWAEYGARAIVLAHSPEEASELLAERASGIVTEINLNNEMPKVLLYEEDHGEF